jgi:hypothetical protein
MPDRSARSFVVTEDVVSGSLDDKEPMPHKKFEDDPFPTQMSKDTDYNDLKVLNEAIETVSEGKNEGTSLVKARAKLERRYRQGSLEESEFRELSEALDRYIK